MSGVALEVPVQVAALLRYSQFIIWQGEVVHADVDVALLNQFLSRLLQDLQLFGD